MSNRSDDFIEYIWKTFSSMKTGLLMLGIVGVVSAIGSFIPQEAMDPEGARAVGAIWRSMGFTHLYTSVWFQMIIGLLLVNLIVCSIQRFSSIFNRTYKPVIPKDQAGVPIKIRTQISGAQIEELFQAAEAVLKKKGFRVTVGTKGLNGFVAQKKRLGNWGSLITHLAFVILILGAMIGALSGFKGYLMAGAGTTVPIQRIDISKGQVSETFNVRINSAEDRILANGERDNWYTDISIMEGDKELARQTISVNHPLTYAGVTFYQSNFAPGALFTASMNGKSTPVLLQNRGGNFYNAPGTELFLVLAAVKADPKEPVVLYQVFKGLASQPVKMGQLAQGQTVNIENAYNLTFNQISNFSGIQVTKDPGVSIVWLGSALLMLGLGLSFYWRAVTISGYIEQQAETVVLTMGVQTGKISLGVKEEFDRLTHEIKSRSNGGHT